MVSQLDLYDALGGPGHHDALWDAREAAAIAELGLARAAAVTWSHACEVHPVRLGPVTLDEYRGCVTRSSAHAIRPVRDPDAQLDPAHPLFGLTVCFTGTLALYTRREATQKVVDAGGEFSPNVTKQTHLLVVGEQDLARLAVHRQSSKMRKAADLAASGRDIEIIDESDLYRMLAT